MTETQLLNRLWRRVKNYSGLCKEFEIKELKEKDFLFLPKEQRSKALAFHQIKTLEKIFNGDWIPNWSNYSEYKWYPYFNVNSSGGLVFFGSGIYGAGFDERVGFYKSEEISDFIGTHFVDIYEKLK